MSLSGVFRWTAVDRTGGQWYPLILGFRSTVIHASLP